MITLKELDELSKLTDDQIAERMFDPVTVRREIRRREPALANYRKAKRAAEEPSLNDIIMAQVETDAFESTSALMDAGF